MLRFNNLKISRFGIIVLSSLLLSGCGDNNSMNSDKRYYNENGVNAYVFDNGSESFLTIQELDGINAKTYRDLMGLVNYDVDILKLISPDEFDLDFMDELEVDHLELITPKDGFDFNGISTLSELDSISITIGSETDLKGFIKYIKKIDLSKMNLTIKINDSSLSEKFASILKNNLFKANSILLEVSNPDCLNYLHNLNADEVKVSLLVSENYDAELNFQINRNVNDFTLEFVATNGNVIVNLNKLIITSRNDNINVNIEKTSRINLIIPEDASLSAPNGTTIDIEIENVLELKNND